MGIYENGLHLQEDKDLKPNPMTFGDIRASLPEVALEMATRKFGEHSQPFPRLSKK